MQSLLADSSLEVRPHLLLVSANGTRKQDTQDGSMKVFSSGPVPEVLLSCLEVHETKVMKSIDLHGYNVSMIRSCHVIYPSANETLDIKISSFLYQY